MASQTARETAIYIPRTKRYISVQRVKLSPHVNVGDADHHATLGRETQLVGTSLTQRTKNLRAQMGSYSRESAMWLLHVCISPLSALLPSASVFVVRRESSSLWGNHVGEGRACETAALSTHMGGGVGEAELLLR